MGQRYWRTQLWLGDLLIEEHIAPALLAEQYANVIRLRIDGLPGRRVRCVPVSEEPEAFNPRSTGVGAPVADGHRHIMTKGI
jgi:hypothetical protein